ncbi:hypothetical protein E2C01_001969 [Portunus trituberculatus]|uniref:Uncharacterized protein n=1 Tax=Portunus trituberculatus TaxID=210409 RepID=A0A5B7CJ47_PORTR|nr:hypothetical protein [Portunus trituberculatus]
MRGVALPLHSSLPQAPFPVPGVCRLAHMSQPSVDRGGDTAYPPLSSSPHRPVFLYAAAPYAFK